MDSTQPAKGVLIQEYMGLHAQQSRIRRRLSVDSNCSSVSSSSSPSSPTMSPSTTPPGTRRNSRSSSLSRSPSKSPYMPSEPVPLSPRSSVHRRPSIPPIPELPEDSTAPLPLSEDENKLFDLSERIKFTLTRLLNAEGVRHDARMRNWVATRLLDTEHELKEQKRRRHSGDSAQVGIIAASLRE